MMNAYKKVLSVAALAGVATLWSLAPSAQAGPWNRRRVQGPVYVQSPNGYTVYTPAQRYVARSYVVPRTNPGNPFPVQQVYGNAYGLGGTGYRPFGSVYSGMGSGAGWGYGIPYR